MSEQDPRPDLPPSGSDPDDSERVPPLPGSGSGELGRPETSSGGTLGQTSPPQSARDPDDVSDPPGSPEPEPAPQPRAGGRADPWLAERPEVVLEVPRRVLAMQSRRDFLL